MRANVCHLDLTITNVMLQDDRSNGWDVLRLIDFGFAQKLNKGKLQLPRRVLQAFSPSCLPPLFLLLLTHHQSMSLSHNQCKQSSVSLHRIAQQHISK